MDTRPRKSPRLLIKDVSTYVKYLVDSGSDITVVPRKFVSTPINTHVKYNVISANNSKIVVHGTTILSFDFGLGRTFTWNVVVADVAGPIIGADFLAHFNLIIDLRKRELRDEQANQIFKCDVVSTAQPSVHLLTANVPKDVESVLVNYPDILKPPRYRERPHETVHFIETTGQPVYARPYRLPRADLDEVRKEYAKSNELGITRPSKSQWASPLVIITRNGKKRYCGNYRRLNAQTVPDRYPIPNISDCTARLFNKKVFSVIDLVKAYHNIPVHPPHVEKTAIISPAGLFEYIRMPFGLRNAPSTWMRFITSVLGDLDFIFIYFDDILVFSETLEQHLEFLNIIFKRLNEFALSINCDKSHFCKSSVEFLGFHISAKGMEPTGKRVAEIREMKRPLTIAALRKVMGIFSFYRKFVKGAADAMSPLYDLLKGRTGKNDKTPIRWTPELKQVFENVKKRFSEYTLLHFVSDEHPIQLTCDASGTAIGGVLEQVVGGEVRPIAFHSEKLSPSQQRWSTYDRELYALFSSVVHFESLIQGFPVTLVTDHRPLLPMFHMKKRIILERRSRWIEFISQFTTEIRHISGSQNAVADALSRPEEAVEALSLGQLYEQQLVESEILDRQAEGTLEVATRVGEKIIVTKSGKIFVPQTLRSAVFRQLHNINHPGGRATIRLVGRTYYWPSMQSDIRRWCRTCVECQRSKVGRHTKAPFGEYKEVDRFEHIHTDIVVMPKVNGYRYAVTFIDRRTRWVEAIPLQRIEAVDIAQAFVNAWVARYGVPAVLTSDRGPQFCSKLFQEICLLLGVHSVQTTAYNPKANGIIERFHRTMKAGLRCRGQNWIEDLPIVLMGIRSALNENENSPAELVFGRGLRLPGEFYASHDPPTDESEFARVLRKRVRHLRPISTGRKNTSLVYLPKDLQTCSKVFVRVDRVRQPLEAPYDGPFEVIKRRPSYFVVRMTHGPDTVSIDRLKPAYELSPSENISPIPIIREENNSSPKTKVRKQSKRVTIIVPDKNERAQPIFRREPVVTRSGRVINAPQRFSP